MNKIDYMTSPGQTTGQDTRQAALFRWLPRRQAQPNTAPPRPEWHPHFGDIAGTDLASWLSSYADHGTPERSIVLATDERTGSEWLCQLLGATGRLGRPSEYLNTAWMQRFVADYPADVATQIVVAHRVGTTANRCFAMKLHPWHLDRLLQGGTVSATFPAVSFVRLVRHDLLAQAISLYRARQTGSFHFHIAKERDVAFDATAIELVLRELAVNRARWDMYVARTGVAPIVVSYEELRANSFGVVRQIAECAGERVRRRDVGATRSIGRQSDVRSTEWRERYLRERGNLDRFDPL